MMKNKPGAAARRSGDHAEHFPTTDELLVQGGDDRIVLNQGANRYGCPPVPDTGHAAFGSATASVISEPAFAAANRLRLRLAEREGVIPHTVTYERELDRIRAELAVLCGADPAQDLQVIFGRSGTDLHLIAAELVGGTQMDPALVIRVDGAETGRGVPHALAGRRFDTPATARVSSDRMAQTMCLSLRLPDGTPRPAAEVDAEVRALVRGGAAAGRRVLLNMIDVSKTGLIAPSPACVLDLLGRLPERFHVLVDGCQFRLAPSTLNAYLNHGCMVAVTGSKFVTGPTFSGALLLTRATAQRLQARLLPRGLSAYSARADWPRTWAAAKTLDNTANYGLLLRWEAALTELRRFRAIPEPQVAGFLERFATSVRAYLCRQPALRLLPTPVPERPELLQAQGWDRYQTIFPFVPCGPDGAPLPHKQTADLHRRLQSSGWYLGQPVACGYHGGQPISALRLCASARLVVEATADGGRHAAPVIDRALATLERVAYLIRGTG